MRKLTDEQFIEKARNIHGDKYDYSLVEYKNNRTKVKIICPIHGVFEQRPGDHLNGVGCKKCQYEYLKDFLSNKKSFIQKAKEVHGDKYDYSKVNYINNKTDVEIICPKHGSFFQSPNSHLNGCGCFMCNGGAKFNKEIFIQRAKEIYKDKYDYSSINYKDSYTKVKIICPKHGPFWQTPNNHLSGHGCRYCNLFKGEEKIAQILGDLNINFERTKMFDDLKDKKKLSYDFYIPSKNILIEYNGEQHYKFVPYFHKRKENFQKQKYHDLLKEEYAKNNGFKLLTISYKNFNIIEEEVVNFLNK